MTITHTQFVELVAKMREAQNKYFRTRDKGALVHSIELEKKVDFYATNQTLILNV